MLSKSNSYSIVFCTVAAIITLLYASDQTANLMMGAGMNGEFSGIFSCFALLICGIVAAMFGGSRGIVAAAGVTAAFVMLSLHTGPLNRYLTLAAVIFSIGAYGMVASRNAVRMLMSIELMLNAVNINMVAFARYIDPVALRGQVFAVFILTVAAAEAAVGLAIVLAIYRNNSTIDMGKFNLLKW